MTTYDPRESMPDNPSYGDPVKKGVWACFNAKGQLMILLESEIAALRYLNENKLADKVSFVEFNSALAVNFTTNATFHNHTPGVR